MSERFAGTIEAFADVDAGDLAAWIEAIPVAEWRNFADPAWKNGGDLCRPIAEALVAAHFPGCALSGVGLFVLAHGQTHPPHRDEQPPSWVCRVHVPIVTNPLALASAGDGAAAISLHMRYGIAYKFNTLATHSVSNGGVRSRVHLVFDVRNPG